MKPSFIDGFAAGAGIPNRTNADYLRARDQWAGWSRQLSDKEREEVESGGYDSGLREGKIFADIHVEN
jgi:hypothetical protein